MKTALLSTPTYPELLPAAVRLARLGWHLVVTPNLREELLAAGLPGQEVADFTGATGSYPFPPTLHPALEQALTLPGERTIDLIYDQPYPLEQGNDGGGHTLLALGLKGERIVTFRPGDFVRVIAALEQDPTHAGIPEALRRELRDHALLQITSHYLAVAASLSGHSLSGWVGLAILPLANGENPYQQPAGLYATEDADALGLPRFALRSQGEAPCFTNLADLDALLYTLSLANGACHRHFGRTPWLALAAKHGNACGMAAHWESPEQALHDALFGHPSAVWGGECVVNFPITVPLARLLLGHPGRKQLLGSPHWMLDLVAAPGYDPAALKLLGRRPRRKILQNPALASPFLSLPLSPFPWHFRQVRGGFLREPRPGFVLDLATACGGNPPRASGEAEALIIAWSVSFSSFHGGNEIALAGRGKLFGVGGGPSTREAAQAAVARARNLSHPLEGSFFCADAFFPFPDAPRLLQEAGCRGGLVPAGGKNDPVIRDFFQAAEMSVGFLPEQFRGFCRH